MRIALAAVALFACSIPDKHPGAVTDGPVAGTDGSTRDAPAPVDGHGSAFACLGQPLPTTAPPSVTLTGVVTEISMTGGGEPMSNAKLALYPAEGEVVTTTTSDAQGNYSMSVPTGGTPFDGYVLANGSGELVTYAFPSRPFDSNTELAITMITQQTLMLAAEVANVPIMNNTAQFAIVIVDCNGTPLSGATLTSSASAMSSVRYASGGLPSPSATSTDASGEVFVFNVAPGGFTVAGKDANGDTLRSHDVIGVGQGLTVALLQP